MAERPLSLTAEMARATLDGRKTQTRRPVTIEWSRCLDLDSAVDRMAAIDRCPYGRPGDRLWVRETWAITTGREVGDLGAVIRYRSDYGVQDVTMPADRPMTLGLAWDRWRPSIHMPRWASRLTLEVTGVRVERVQAISEADAMAEGVRSQDAHVVISAETGIERALSGTHRGAFACLWDSIYAARGLGWSADPWVWVVSYRVVEARS